MRVCDMTIGTASAQEIEEFCQRWHYTGRGGTKCWRYGLYHDGTLIGVVAYNVPARSVCASVFGPDFAGNVAHMGRLVLAQDAPRNSESRLIAGSLRQLQTDKPNLWAVLTYAATDAGHIGYVYQATNAIYTGTGGDGHYFEDSDGRRRATKTTINGVPRRLSKAEAIERGWTVHKSMPKHRYLYVLGNKAERRARMKLLRYPSLPYPKAEGGRCEAR